MGIRGALVGAGVVSGVIPIVVLFFSYLYGIRKRLVWG